MTDPKDQAPAGRRDLLATTANPDERHDYMVMLEGSFVLGGGDQAVAAELCYVADRHVLTLDAFSAYLDTLAGGSWPTLEAVATIMLADVNNELIPRWAQIRLITGSGAPGERHSVIIEDRQPGWDNPALLARHGTSWRVV